MNAGVTLSLHLLRQSTSKRLALVLGALVVSLGLYGLTFPTAYFDVVLILPLVLSTWLFGWQGGLLCIAGISLILGISDGVTFSATFWSPAWFVPFVTGMLYGLAVCLTIALLRRVIDALLDAQHTVERAEWAYQQEHMLNELKDQALQNLGHELRTPLTSIQGYLELLETYQNQLDTTSQVRFVRYARNGCEEVLSLITTALETAQTAGTQQHLRLSVFSLRPVIQTVLAHLEPQFQQNHHVELNMSESVLVRADPGFVRQIVRNLLSNVGKYTPARTSVSVSALPMSASNEPHGQAGFICVRVDDQGPGIPLEQQPLLFQRSVRLPNAAHSTQPGSGLGLAICKQLVEAMGGSIWMESTGRDGEGCCFSFTLMSGSTPGIEGQRAYGRGCNGQENRTAFGTYEPGESS